MDKTNDVNLGTANSFVACRGGASALGRELLHEGRRKCLSGILMFSLLAGSSAMLSGCSDKTGESDSPDMLPEHVFLSDGKGEVRIYNTRSHESVCLTIGADAKFSPVCDNAFWVKTGDMTVLYKISSKEAKPASSTVYSEVTAFVAGCALAGDRTQPIQIIDTDGNTVATLPDNVEVAQAFTPYGLAEVQTSDGKQGIIDREGKYVIAPEHSTAKVLSSDRFLVGSLPAGSSAALDYYVTDRSGKRISNISAKCKDFDPMHYGDGLFAQVEYDDEGQAMNSVAFIDEKGDKAFSLDIYSSEAMDGNYMFRHGLLAYPAVGGRWRVANTRGETVYEAKCDYMSIASPDLLIVRYTDRQSAVVDIRGNFVIPIAEDVTFEALANNSYLCELSEYFQGVKVGSKYFIQHGESRTPTYEKATTGDYNACRDCVWYTNPGNAIMPLVTGIRDGKFFGYSSSMAAPDVALKAGAEIGDESEARTYMDYSLSVKLIGRTTMNDVHGIALFTDNLVYEKKHVEREGSGWFVTEKEVSDGYAFNPEARLEGFYVTYCELMPDIKKEDFANAIAGTLTKSGFKATCGTTYEKDGVLFHLMDEWRVGNTSVGPGILINF